MPELRRFSTSCLTSFIISLLVVLFFTGCKRKSGNSATPPTPEVATIIVATKSVELTTELPGRISAYMVADIKPQVSGIIQRRLFVEGTDVRAGEVLYEIDPAPFQAALEQTKAAVAVARENASRAQAALQASTASVARAKASMELAQTNLRRIEELFKDKVVAQSQYDQAVTEASVAEAALQAAEAQRESDQKAVAVAEAALKQAEAALQTAQINLNYTRITAPISGRIGKSNVTEGALVTAYQPLPLATIQQLDPVYVDVMQSITEMMQLKRRLEEGQVKPQGETSNKVKLILDDGRIYPLEGEIQFRDVTVDQSTGSVVIRIVFPNPEGILFPGMFVRAIVKEGVNDQAIMIPQQAVSRDHKGNPYVLLVDQESKVVQRSIILDRAIGNEWLVTAGLSPGEHVVVEGMQKIRPGSAVKEVPFSEASKETSGANKQR